MKTLRSFKNGRFPHAVANHAMANLRVPQIGVLLRQCFHAPNMSKLASQIKDLIGSGLRKMMRYGKAYGGVDPELIEGDVFRIIVKTPEENLTENNGENAKTGGAMGGAIGGAIGGAMGGAIELSTRQREIVQLILTNPKVTYRQIAQRFDINDAAVIKHIKSLREKGVLKRIGGTRGHWEVLVEDKGRNHE